MPKSLEDVRSLIILIKEILVVARRLEGADKLAKRAVVMDEKLSLDNLFDTFVSTPNPSTPEKIPMSPSSSRRP